jgi:Tfp pilus assembly protein PilO
LLWAFFTFVYTTKKGKIDALKVEIEMDRQSWKTMEAAAADLEGLEAEILKERERLALMKSKLSSERRVVQILRQLSEETRRLDITLLSLSSVRKQQESEGRREGVASRYGKQVIAVTMRCPYGVLSSYLKRLGGLPFYVEIEDVTIERLEEYYPNLLVSLALSTYVPTS